MARNRDEKRQRTPAKRHRIGSPAEKLNKTTEVRVRRRNTDPGKKIPAFRTHDRKFDMVVDGVPYSVRSSPFLFNDELRFRVRINGGAEHVFTWDTEVSTIRAIDDESSTLPSVLEEALSERLRKPS